MKQEIKSNLTKQLIVDKAFALFYKYGFNAVSVDRVMKETKLTKGAFYHHFKDKKELGLAVISDRIHTRVYENMVVPLFEEGDLFLILKNVFCNRIKTFSIVEKQSGCPLNNLINEISDNEVAYQLALKKVIEVWKLAIVNLLEKGKQNNSINEETNAPSVAVFLISAFEGVRGIRKLYVDDTILDEYVVAVEKYIDLLR